MKASIRSKLEQISERFQEITALLADPDDTGAMPTRSAT